MTTTQYDVRCPYCQRQARFMTSEQFYGKDYGTNVYVCLYCDAYIGTYGRTTRPMGPLANEELRDIRRKTHLVFDTLWINCKMTRSEAYRWMAWKLRISQEQAHIAKLSSELCNLLIRYSIQYWLTFGEWEVCPECDGSGDAGDPHDIADYNPCLRCNGEGSVQRGDITERR